MTIVVGRAHRQKVPCPTGAAPRWISNVGVLKKDMKMDEDLTGKYPYSVITKCLKIVIAIKSYSISRYF